MSTPKEIADQIEANCADMRADRISWDDFSKRQRALWGKADDLKISDQVGRFLAVNKLRAAA